MLVEARRLAGGRRGRLRGAIGGRRGIALAAHGREQREGENGNGEQGKRSHGPGPRKDRASVLRVPCGDRPPDFRHGPFRIDSAILAARDAGRPYAACAIGHAPPR
ncbi:hypothetical protein PAGU2595_015230 [Lysobacter xanthus]